MTNEEKLNLVQKAAHAENVHVVRQTNTISRWGGSDHLDRSELPAGAIYYEVHTEGTFSHAKGIGATMEEAIDAAVKDARKLVEEQIVSAERQILQIATHQKNLRDLINSFPKEK